MKLGSRRDIQIIGGAIGLGLLSRVAGLAREFLIVGFIGVHDFTDAYFSLSTIVLWLQNWAFGALNLYLVPKLLSLPFERRRDWFRAEMHRAALVATALAVLFWLFFQPIERWMLSGRNVLGPSAALLLAACIPLTTVAGFAYGRSLCSTIGIGRSAKALLLGNLWGIALLTVCAATGVERSLILPLSLCATQGATMLLLFRGLSTNEEEKGTESPQRAQVGRSQAVATTAENVGFNLNMVAQQAIAGMLPTGAVTMNAYATRLVLIPLSGLFQPILQRLLIFFSTKTKDGGYRAIRQTALFGTVSGLAVGGTLWGASTLVAGILPSDWVLRFAEYHFPMVIGLYGAYSGVMFVNQALARYLFARQTGWLYTGVLLAAYATGTWMRFVLTPRFGIVSLPLGALLAEGTATLVLCVLIARVSGQLELAPTGPLVPGPEEHA